MDERTVGGCRIHFLPVIRGLVSESDKVSAAISEGHECVAVSLGLEEIEAIKKTDTGEWDYDPSDMDAVYAHNLKRFGEVRVPVPAFKTAIDLCPNVMPLDMSDEEFTKVYCDCIGIGDLLKEKKVAKKGMKDIFDMTSPETFVRDWDKLVNTIRGQYAVSLRREEFIADSLIDLAKYRKDVLAVVDFERLEGILFELDRKTEGE